MGCGESKHAVATASTISRKNSKAGSKREKPSEAVEETRQVDDKTSSDGGSDGVATSVSRKNSSVRSRKGKSSETIEENTKDDSKTSSSAQPKGENKDRDSGGDNSGAGVEGKKIAESSELKKDDNVKDKTMDKERKEETVGEVKIVEETKKDQKVGEDPKKETVKDQKAVEETAANGERETVKKEEEKKPADLSTTKAEVSTAVEKQEEKADGSSKAEDLKKDQ
ncbi:hypothetical protein V6N13_037704 [Hibiscus sabdariffa]|uniref:Uncharacterized protein n=1 Tax=Hibiscus sabdariffa TaxID=183260 RepID=A0ABR2S4B5_9ROSI